MEKLRKNQGVMQIVNALKLILTLFTSTFFTSYIVTLTPENILSDGIINISIFYISQYFVYTLIYFFLSKFIAKSNRVSYFRIGILVNGILLIALVFFGEDISQWIILAGALIGISDAFYNSSYLVMKNELVSSGNINNFNILTSVITNVINIIVPTILGFVIDVSSFSYIALYVAFIVIIQFGLSFLISSPKHTTSFNLRNFFRYLRDDKFARSKIKFTYINALLAGVKNTYKALIVILTIYVFKTNLSLGILTSIFSITTTLLLLLFKKFEYHKKMKKLAVYMIISIFPIVCCILFIFLENEISIILLNLALTIAIQFSEYGSNCERDAIIKNLNKHEFIPEHQFVVETCMCICRIISYAILLVVGIFANIILFKVLLIILISINPIKFFVMYKQTLIRKELENLKQNEDN